MTDRPIRAVSFDLGQTLVQLDEILLQTKLRRCGVEASPRALEAALPEAWDAYDRAVRAGLANHPWKLFMRTLLERAGAQPAAALAQAVDVLWDDQPQLNLWRKPISDMLQLARELLSSSVRIGVLTNSEGRAAELIEELGWADLFSVVVDSGRVGIEKPDAGIFAIMSERLVVDADQIVHIGDSLGADVQGAVKAGMRAIWFTGRAEDAPDGVLVCQDAADVRRALDALGLWR